MSARWPLSLQILRAACEATGDAFESADPETNFLARVSRGGASFVAGETLVPAFPINPHFAAALADDKALMAGVLAEAEIAVTPSRVFFTDPMDAARYSGTGRAPADALTHAEELGYPVFAKLNRGTHGRGAARIADANELIAYIGTARPLDRMFHIQPVIEEPEARVFVLRGRVRFLYRRERLTLAGDGRRTFAAILADHLNDPRFADEPSALASVAETLARLARAKHALGDIPAKGEPLFTADAANLAQGGALRDLAFAAPDELHDWAARIAAATGLEIFGADVFCGAGLDDRSSYRVIEINANPSLSGLWRAGEQDACVAIWREVLDGYFAR